jgi:hypothetical protein
LPDSYLPGCVIISEHPAAIYGYSSSLDIYHQKDKRFSEPAAFFNLKHGIDVFNDTFEKALLSEKQIITIGYNHLITKVIKLCLNTCFINQLSPLYRVSSRDVSMRSS